MTKMRAIRAFCAECAGSVHDVTFCTGLTCPLWEHRLGAGMATKVYRGRIEAGWSHNGEAARAARGCGLTLGDFLVKRPIRAAFPAAGARKTGEPGPGVGSGDDRGSEA